jgi:hypothetical protein
MRAKILSQQTIFSGLSSFAKTGVGKINLVLLVVPSVVAMLYLLYQL